MKYINSIFLLFIIGVQASDLGYTQESVYNCRMKPDYTMTERREILTLYPIDRWVYAILSPITFIGASLIMFVFFMDRKLFGLPGDILFIISFAELLKAYQEASSGIYAISQDIAPNPNGAFCQVNGIIASSSFIIINIYVLIYAGYPLVLLYNALGSTKKVIRVFNYILTFMILIPVMAIAVATKSISISLNGLCTISPNSTESDIVVGSSYTLCILTFLIMSVAFIVAFKKLVPKNSPMRALRGQFLRYYQRFMLFSIIMKSLICICSLINLLNCIYFLNPYVNITETIENIIMAVYSFGQIFLISTDPLLRPYFYKFYYNKHRISDTTGKSISMDKFSLDDTPKKETEFQNVHILEELHAQMKIAQVYSMLAGVQLLRLHKSDEICQYKDIGFDEQNQSSMRSSSSGEMSDLVELSKIQFSKEETEECLYININDQIVKDNLESIVQIQCFEMKCLLYAPKIFNHFVTMDQIDIENSFDILKNQKQISEFQGPDGGKSGEFFFFSHDNKLIIKTMRQAELLALKKRLLAYGNYLNAQSDSLISKIYGLYTFERQELNKPKVHFIIMKNLSLGIQRKYILRVFDMKGSEYDREVLQKDKQQDLTKLTLKDTDFIKTEQQIWVETSKLIALSDSLTRDSNLLKKMQLLDYSLLVMKIDWGSSGLDITSMIDENSLNIVPSNKEKGIYYHIAIIDYLQEWNVNKGMERATKKIIKLNHQLDTSAQEPGVYALRFQEKLINRILPI